MTSVNLCDHIIYQTDESFQTRTCLFVFDEYLMMEEYQTSANTLFKVMNHICCCVSVVLFKIPEFSFRYLLTYKAAREKCNVFVRYLLVQQQEKDNTNMI